METESRPYFDDVAPRWDQVRKEFFTEAVRDRALEVAKVRPGRQAADLGAGTGFITEGLLGAGLNVIAVDLSAQMLARLEEKLGSSPKLACRQGSAEVLPIETAAVDYAFANMVLHHVEDPPAAIAEAVRILRPAGKLVITDMDKHDHEFLRIEQHDRWLGFERADIQRWLEGAGLSEVTVDCVGEDCCATSKTDGTRAEVSIFVASGTKP